MINKTSSQQQSQINPIKEAAQKLSIQEESKEKNKDEKPNNQKMGFGDMFQSQLTYTQLMFDKNSWWGGNIAATENLDQAVPVTTDYARQTFIKNKVTNNAWKQQNQQIWTKQRGGIAASHVKDDDNLVKLNTEEKLEYEPDLSDDALLRNEFFLKVITDAIKEETDLSVRYLTEQKKISRDYKEGEDAFLYQITKSAVPASIMLQDIFYRPVSFTKDDLIDYAYKPILGFKFQQMCEDKTTSDTMNEALKELCQHKDFPVFKVEGPRITEEYVASHPIIKYTDSTCELRSCQWVKTQPALQGALNLPLDFYSKQRNEQLVDLTTAISELFTQDIQDSEVFQTFLATPLYLNQILAILLFGEKTLCGCRPHYQSNPSLCGGISDYIKFTQTRSHMDLKWARNYLVDQFTYKELHNKFLPVFQDLVKLKYNQGRAQIVEIINPVPKPAESYAIYNEDAIFRQNSNSWTSHHTSFCHSILEPDQEKHCALSVAHFEATHSDDPLHLIDHGLPHPSSFIFLAALHTNIFESTAILPSVVASFTGFNAIELDLLEGVPLGYYGEYDGRQEDCYKSFKTRDSILGKKKRKNFRPIKAEKREKKVIRLQGNRSKRSTHGHYTARKVFNLDFPAKDESLRQKEWEIFNESVAALFSLAQQTPANNRKTQCHKGIVQFKMILHPEVERNEPKVQHTRTGQSFQQPGDKEVYVVTGNVALDDDRSLAIMLNACELLSQKQKSAVQRERYSDESLIQDKLVKGSSMSMNRQYNKIRTLKQFEQFVKARIENCGKQVKAKANQLKDDGDQSSAQKQSLRQKESELFKGFYWLSNVSVFFLVKSRRKQWLPIDYRNQICSVISSGDQIRHVNMVSQLFDLQKLSSYLKLESENEGDPDQFDEPIPDFDCPKHDCIVKIKPKTVFYSTLESMYNAFKTEDDLTPVQSSFKQKQLEDLKQYIEQEGQTFSAWLAAGFNLIASKVDQVHQYDQAELAMQGQSIAGGNPYQTLLNSCYTKQPGETDYSKHIRSLIGTYCSTLFRDCADSETQQILMMLRMSKIAFAQQKLPSFVLNNITFVPYLEHQYFSEPPVFWVNLRAPLLMDLEPLFNLPNYPQRLYVVSEEQMPLTLARLATVIAFFSRKKFIDYSLKVVKYVCGMPLVLYNWGLLHGFGIVTPPQLYDQMTTKDQYDLLQKYEKTQIMLGYQQAMGQMQYSKILKKNLYRLTEKSAYNPKLLLQYILTGSENNDALGFIQSKRVFVAELSVTALDSSLLIVPDDLKPLQVNDSVFLGCADGTGEIKSQRASRVLSNAVQEGEIRISSSILPLQQQQQQNQVDVEMVQNTNAKINQDEEEQVDFVEINSASQQNQTANLPSTDNKSNTNQSIIQDGNKLGLIKVISVQPFNIQGPQIVASVNQTQQPTKIDNTNISSLQNIIADTQIDQGKLTARQKAMQIKNCSNSIEGTGPIQKSASQTLFGQAKKQPANLRSKLPNIDQLFDDKTDQSQTATLSKRQKKNLRKQEQKILDQQTSAQVSGMGVSVNEQNAARGRGTGVSRGRGGQIRQNQGGNPSTRGEK